MSTENTLTDERDKTVSENAAELKNFMDIEYWIDIQVGKALLTVSRLLALKEGNRIKLDRVATDNVVLAIEGTAIAEAEVVVIKNGTSARIIDIV